MRASTRAERDLQEANGFIDRAKEIIHRYARDPAKLLEGRWDEMDAFIDGRWQQVFVKMCNGRRVAKWPTNDPVDLTDSEWLSLRKVDLEVRGAMPRTDPCAGSFILPGSHV